MKLYQLNENEIKITLSKDDLKELDLTLSTIDYNTTKTRKAIWEIFDRARDEIGFDAAKNKIYVKLYPLSDGGCEMYVSKLFSKQLSYYSSSTKPLCVKRKKLKYVCRSYAFHFKNFDDLYTACQALPYVSQSSLFLDENGEYILTLKGLCESSWDLKRWNEFSDIIDCKHISAYLDERCEKICENHAIDKILGK